MNQELQLWLFMGLACFLLVVLQLLRRRTLLLRYALTWLLSSGVMLIAVCFPQIPTLLAHRLGIVEPANAVFLLQGLFVMLILLSLTTIISRLSERNKILVQNAALLEYRLRAMETQHAPDENCPTPTPAKGAQ